MWTGCAHHSSGRSAQICGKSGPLWLMSKNGRRSFCVGTITVCVPVRSPTMCGACAGQCPLDRVRSQPTRAVRVPCRRPQIHRRGPLQRQDWVTSCGERLALQWQDARWSFGAAQREFGSRRERLWADDLSGREAVVERATQRSRILAQAACLPATRRHARSATSTSTTERMCTPMVKAIASRGTQKARRRTAMRATATSSAMTKITQGDKRPVIIPARNSSGLHGTVITPHSSTQNRRNMPRKDRKAATSTSNTSSRTVPRTLSRCVALERRCSLSWDAITGRS